MTGFSLTIMFVLFPNVFVVYIIYILIIYYYHLQLLRSSN